MAYGAFALFFNVDKIMTLILSYNEPTEGEGKHCRIRRNFVNLFYSEGDEKGHENPALQTNETDFTDIEPKSTHLEPSPISLERPRTDTNSSQVNILFLRTSKT